MPFGCKGRGREKAELETAQRGYEVGSVPLLKRW